MASLSKIASQLKSPESLYPAPPGDDYSRETWRYLRLAMATLVVGLAGSVLYEHFASGHPDHSKGHCWLGSISAYYYTPVHAFFVGALVTIGICLIALKGSTEWEDIFLNVAGAFAPVVALVPTPNVPTSSHGECWSALTDKTNRELNIGNNVVALLIMATTGLLLLLVLVIARNKKDNKPLPSGTARLGYAAVVVLYLLTAIAFFTNRPWFDEWAHPIAAITMFVFIFINAVYNAGHLYFLKKGEGKPAHWYNRYAMIALAMVIAAVANGVAGASGWNYAVFGIEASLITIFAVFWILQTIELWDQGLRPPPTSPGDSPAKKRKSVSAA